MLHARYCRGNACPEDFIDAIPDESVPEFLGMQCISNIKVSLGEYSQPAHADPYVLKICRSPSLGDFPENRKLYLRGRAGGQAKTRRRNRRFGGGRCGNVVRVLGGHSIYLSVEPNREMIGRVRMPVQRVRCAVHPWP